MKASTRSPSLRVASLLTARSNKRMHSGRVHGGMLLLVQMSSNSSPSARRRGLHDYVVPLPFQGRLAVLVAFTKNSHVLDGCLVGVILILDSARHFFSSDRRIYLIGPVYERR